MTKPTKKTIFEQRTKCPYCSKQIVTRLVRNTIKPGTPAQTELLFFAEKELQTTLEKDYQMDRELRKKALDGATGGKLSRQEAKQAKIKKRVKRKGF